MQMGFLHFRYYDIFVLIAKYESYSVYLTVSLITKDTEIFFEE